ncbi:MFS transporter [Paracraurococcus lichenis]|uniref:MFS transporter n=1 Tax=Paracraurococcus lichenis TaxID=3064888 RepID=A0ABT9EAK4_9PROT|nr:MFS transporter [Paracraurococcus sp. LOR1-02]MDO9713229.1 MFS transporter [Paracraurococcus sp. LOR1-02]
MTDATGRPGLWRIVLVAAAVMAVSMGLRQCFGLFLGPSTVELGASAAAFGFAVALHNLVWGLSQPVVGALGDRFGARPVLLGCGLLYTAGLLLFAASGNGFVALDLGIGLLTGLGIAGTGFGVLLGAVSRAAPPERRGLLVGLVSGASSAGVLVLAPLGEALIAAAGWRDAALAFAGVCGAMVALSLLLGGAPTGGAAQQAAAPAPGAWNAARTAMAHPGFVAMSVAFLACGFQLMFITTHLPRFLGLCGLAPSVGAAALAVIGVCNAIGSYVFGVLGQRYSPKRLLAGIYATRTAAILLYLNTPVSEASTLVFAAVMGATWLGVVPLVSALIGRLFGLANFSLLFGLAFVCHQIGGFAGSWMGGIVLDATGGYDAAWWALVGIGAAAALLQWPMDDRPRPADGRPREAAI